MQVKVQGFRVSGFWGFQGCKSELRSGGFRA